MIQKRFILVAALSIALPAALLAALLSGGSAGAHAVQVGSDPPANGQLAAPPASITIEFSEPIEPSVTTVQLWDQSGEPVELGAVDFPSSTRLVAQVPSELPSGIYTVIWRNLSTVDGHIWSGSYPFVVLGPNGEVPEGSVPIELQELAAPPSENPEMLESIARWVVLLGAGALFGGAVYVSFVAQPATRMLDTAVAGSVRSLSRTVLLLSGTIAALFVLQGSILQLALQADELGGLDKVDEILGDTRSGYYLIARQALILVALGSIAVLWRAPSRVAGAAATGLLLVSSFGVLVTLSLVSHAAGGDGPFWTSGNDILHLAAASLWIGGLVHIAFSMPRWLDSLQGARRTVFAAESFRRFSILAAFSVLALLASGVLSALAQFTSWSELVDSTYGKALLGKMGAMLPLLAVAGLNAFILQPRVVEAARHVGGPPGGPAMPESVARLQSFLLNSVRAEAVLGVAVLVAAAVLIQIEPPRALAEAQAQSGNVIRTAPAVDTRPYFLKANQAGGLVVSLRIDPAKVGANEFEVGLGSEFGGVGDVLETRLEFNHTTEDIGPSQLDLPLMGSAKFAADGSNLSIPGEWEVTVIVRRGGEDDVSTTFDVPISSEGPEAEAAAGGGDDSIWNWPFEGGRSAAAIGVLAGGAAGIVVVGAWQTGRLRRR